MPGSWGNEGVAGLISTRFNVRKTGPVTVALLLLGRDFFCLLHSYLIYNSLLEIHKLESIGFLRIIQKD